MKRIIPSFIIIIIGILIAYYWLSRPKKLKNYNPIDINPELVDKSVKNIDKYHRVGSFNLVNQDGNNVTEKDFKGKIYVADFFFVTCPTICPKMATQMKRVYKHYQENDDILFLSHTVMPESDSVPVLKAYADKLNVSATKWKFVTGDKKQIYNLLEKLILQPLPREMVVLMILSILKILYW